MTTDQATGTDEAVPTTDATNLDRDTDVVTDAEHEPASAVAARRWSVEVDAPSPDAPDLDAVSPQAPWQHRLAEHLGALHSQIPTLWSQRMASWSERAEYALRGDWTSAGEHAARRQLYTLGVVACLLVDGLVVVPIRWLTETPIRLGTALAVWIVLSTVL